MTRRKKKIGPIVVRREVGITWDERPIVVAASADLHPRVCHRDREYRGFQIRDIGGGEGDKKHPIDKMRYIEHCNVLEWSPTRWRRRH